VAEGAEWLRGRATLLAGNQAQHAHDLLAGKYGWQRRLLDLLWIIGGHKPRAAIAIDLTEQSS
jgi:hypothetical protein